MSMLASLAHAYDRMADRHEVPPFGYSFEKIGFVISLNEDGTLASKPADLREQDGRKLTPRAMAVPQSEKRTSGIAPNFLWDKTSYVLGITVGDGKRLADEHAAFRKRHAEMLAGSEDAGLWALRSFLEGWKPEHFASLGWPEEMKDQNVIFALESERLNGIYLHDRPAARSLWTHMCSKSEKVNAVCLVTGQPAPIARLHPAIKGVWGAQSSGASIVSFNLDAFESYNHVQGENAPVSEAAAFAYTTVLNKFLSGSRNRIQIGDASTVFWADASDAVAARTGESIFEAMFGEPEPLGEAASAEEKLQAQKTQAILEKIRQGKPLEDFDGGLAKNVRFYILGLAPNAARLSIRFWFENTFGVLAENYRQFVQDMKIEPPPHKNPNPPLWRYLIEMAVQGKRDNVPPNLGGEWMRAILIGTNYPRTLIANVLMRIRADGEINALRVAMLKAVLNRNSKHFKGKVPVTLDSENKNKGYVLGRLFAVYEKIQTEALGNVNATIKDKFYGSASAQPRKVFALLDKGSVSHLSKIGKQAYGHRVNMEKQVSEIMTMMSPADDPFPSSLSSEQQALFALGYYHQRSDFFKSKKTDASKENGQ